MHFNRTLLLTILALIAFAANSVLCRMALGAQLIDPAGFTVIRLLSGTLALTIILYSQQRLESANQSSAVGPILNFPRSALEWLAAGSLFTYAACFSFAYVTLNTASGAIILFASVQFSMLSYSLWRGKRYSKLEWLGIVIALCGFLSLMLPSAAQPSPAGFLLMLVAGIAWGSYSLIGQSAKQPIKTTARNFIGCIPFCVLLLLTQFSVSGWNDWNVQGIYLAIASGVLASAVGYCLWYAALPQLKVSVAAVSQLAVPVIAALGGLLLMNESISLLMGLSAALTLGGIALTSLKKPAN
ncbi:DMT family transporter [Aliikangiella sp. IMCC44653]